MSPRVDNLADLPFNAALDVDETCDRFESAFRSGSQPRIEDFVADKTEPLRTVLITELISVEIQLRLKSGSSETLVADDYHHRFPGLRVVVDQILKRAVLPRVDMNLPSVNAAASSAELTLPRKLGNYVLESKIGHGGMGTVYLALHQALDRRVAFKLMQPERMRKPEAVARFQREMKAVARLHHPNIVMAYDAGEVEGLHFLAMERVSGWDLASITRCYGPLPIPVACESVRQAALGLQHVYQNGLVHRDIKPSNLMLTRDGEVKLLDLGLARLRDDGPDERLTHDASPMGTMEYIAPEQARNPHGVDIRADLYSLGCTLFKLLSGHSPFAQQPRTSVQLLTAHLESTPPSIRDCRDAVPHELAELIDWLLKKAPADRPQTPEEVASALKPFASDRILKSFAAAVSEICDAEGRLPDKPPISLGSETGRWQSPAESEPEPRPEPFEELPEQSVAVPATHVPSPRALSIPRPNSTMRWVIGSIATAFLLAAGYIQLQPMTVTVTTLIPRTISADDMLIGHWQSKSGALISPANAPGIFRLATLHTVEYELNLSVASIEGGLHWTIVSTSEPRFMVEFRPGLRASTKTSDSTDEDLVPPNWRGDWGDYSDTAERRFRFAVRKNQLIIERNGETIREESIPVGTLSCQLPENASSPGIYLLTENSSLRFRDATLTAPKLQPP